VRFTFALVALCAATLSAQPTFDFEGRYWMPRMTPRIRVDAAGFGTDIDAQRDLGMANTNFPEGQFTYHSAGHHRLRFTFTPIDFAGDNFVSRTIVFRGTQYTFGTRVVSELQVQHLQLSWAYQFSAADGRVKIGPMVEADGFLISGRLQAPDIGTPVDQKESLSAGILAAGLALDIRPHRRIDICGEAAGMKAGSYGYFVGSDAGVHVRPWRGLLFSVGYRTFNLHVTNTPDFARLNMRGPFVGAGWRF
jgi:hypothetical protein